MYIDGFNLYFGGRSICGRGAPGWRWLNVRSLAESLVVRRRSWSGATIERVVYCTAMVDGATNPSARLDQDSYLRALQMGVVDHIEFGRYVSRVKRGPLATPNRKGRPVLAAPGWPVTVQSGAGLRMPDAKFIVSYAHREEKGSDVNVASHLLADVFQRRVDAVVMVSNDSDLALPASMSRSWVPTGVVNPSGGRLAGALHGDPNDGVGRHWWCQLTDSDYKTNQLPSPYFGVLRPPGW